MTVPSKDFEAFVQSIRDVIAPFAHLSDEELAASPDLDGPTIMLLLGYRTALRTYDADAADEIIGEIIAEDGEVRAVATPRKTP